MRTHYSLEKQSHLEGKRMPWSPSIVAESPSPGKPKLLDQMRDVLRMRHYSYRTEQAYLNWARRFILFNGKRHPREMAEAEVMAFLTSLARYGNVAAATQNQALSALLFLYKEVLKVELGWLDSVERAKRPARVPVVLSKAEIRRVLSQMHGQHKLMAQLLYGSGLRLMECVRLRVKDIDFAYARIVVRDGSPHEIRDYVEILVCVCIVFVRGSAVLYRIDQRHPCALAAA